MKSQSRLPVITLILIAANMFAAFAVVWDPDMLNRFGFKAEAPSFHTALSSLFLHENLLHLAGNMVFLAAVGAAAEIATGSARFGIVYFISGLLGVLAFALFVNKGAAPTPLVGASGAVAGLAAYYSIRYIQLKVPLAPKVGVSVLAVTILWLVLQFVGAFVRIGGASGGVSFWAHIGGFAGGLLLSLVFRAPDLGHVKLGHAVLDQMNERGPAAVAVAARQHLDRHPNDVKALRDLADAEHSLGHESQEAQVLLKLLEVLPESEQPEVLERLAGLSRLPTLPSIRRTLLADRFKVSHPETSRRLLQSVVDGPESDPQWPEALFMLASFEREQEPEKAAEHFQKLVERCPLHPTVEVARKRGWIG